MSARVLVIPGWPAVGESWKSEISPRLSSLLPTTTSAPSLDQSSPVCEREWAVRHRRIVHAPDFWEKATCRSRRTGETVTWVAALILSGGFSESELTKVSSES